MDAIAQLQGYRLTEKLYESSRTVVYRGLCERDQRPVVVKFLKNEFPSFQELVQFGHQYSMAKDLDAPNIVKPLALVPCGRASALVMEDFGGCDLKHFLKSTLQEGCARLDAGLGASLGASLNGSLNGSLGKVSVDLPIRLGDRPEHLILFLQIALQVAEALEALGDHRIIHKDIKPANILIHPQSHQVKLIDFSIASTIPQGAQSLQNINLLEGTLAYVSPEQTGRMNSGIDCRSDFYAFGVTCYELLTGQLPFTATDPMEIVHSHLAQQPTPPHELCPSTLPKVLSDWVLKLMAKNTENRYQSAFGLKKDLQRCLYELKKNGSLEPFELGQADVCDRFILAERLYGRQQDVDQLLAAFDRTRQGSAELVLVAGTAGMGKTAVVHEICQPISRQGSYFIQGKYDPCSCPLFGFIQAFRSLIRLVLSEGDVELKQWQQRVLTAFGNSAQVLIEVIPELAELIGPQPPAVDLSAAAAENRFNRLMQEFVQIFTCPQRPLVIFLDNLQWADAASLKLLQQLMQAEYLLLIGAYRDHEVSVGHPLKVAIAEISTHHSDQVHSIFLAPLTVAQTQQFVSDSLRCTAAAAQPLAELMDQKAQGNPFFAAQLLTNLHAEGVIVFDKGDRQWHYDLNQTSCVLSASDITEFVCLRLKKLPASTQATLSFAACMGAEFDLKTLVSAAQLSLEATVATLWPAIQAGLIVPVLGHKTPTYRFLHNRVQQAAYGLIDLAQQAATHLSIGQHLLKDNPGLLQAIQQASSEFDAQTLDQPLALLAIDQQLFDIVNHLNQGISLIQEGSERSELAALRPSLVHLNRLASRKAKSAAAHTAALDYLIQAIALMPLDGWQTQYALMLHLHNEASEVAYLKGDLATMQRTINAVLQQANDLLDKTDVYEIQIQASIGQNHFLEAIDITLNVLAQLGVEIPAQPNQIAVQQALQTTAEQLSQQPIADLVNLPTMSNRRSLAIIRLLTKAVSAAYIARPEVLPLLVCTGIDQALTHGNSPLSSFLYGWYGVILCGLSDEIASAYSIGELALSLLEKIPAKDIQTRVRVLVYFLIRPWKAPLASTLRPLQSLYQTGLENGDHEYAAWAITIHCHYSYLAGHSLEKLATKIIHYRASVSQLQQQAASNYLSIYQQVVLNLLGEGSDPGSDPGSQLEGEAYSEAKMLPIQLAANDITGLCYVYLNKGMLAYLFSQPQAAKAHFDHALCYLTGISGSQWMPALLFYDSLSCLAIGNMHQLPRVIVNQEKLKTWARLAPMNHLHRWHLVEAERCRLSGEKARAIDHYDQAIALAQANGFVQEEAIANEIAARFYLLWGKGRVAQSYLIDAYYGYSRWGAKAKIVDLERRYPQLLADVLQMPQQNLSSSDTILAYANTTHTSSNGASDAIDLTTLLHTSQVLSSEIELDKLLSALLEAVIQNAGAQKCVLLMPKPEENQQEAEWVIEARAECSQPPVLLTSQPVQPGKEVPLSLINQVERTGEPAIVSNAAVHASLAVDPYVLRYQPKSVLCAPILNKGKLIAILYLENNLTMGAFTRNRVEVLNLICTQAAISLENARLYHQAQGALHDLQSSHMQLFQNEKMSALGNLMAGVAHEINNPVNFLKGNLKPAFNYVKDLLGVLELVLNDEPREIILEEMEEINFAFVQEDLLSLLHSMTFGISRISDISHSLRSFSRADADYKIAFNLHEGLDSTLLILKHRLGASESCPPIEVVKNYGKLPDIVCFAGQLNQVFMNLVANAIDALEEQQQRSLTEVINNPSRITITTALADPQLVTIRIADNGPGMSADVQARVFDHLFTTKPVGKGTGLGLAISYAIVVEKHGGTLTVDSEIGKGTVFEITLPVGC